MKHHFQNQVSGFAGKGRSVRQTTLRSGPCWIKGSRSGVPGFLQLLFAPGNSCQLQGRCFIAHTQPDSSLQLDAASGVPESVRTAAGDVFPWGAGMCGHITMSHGWDMLKSHQFSPFVPFLRQRIKGRGGLWAGIVPWLPASVCHGRIPSLTWRLPPVPCVPLISSSRGEQVGPEIKIKYFLMQTVTANPQLEQANHYSNNKRWLSNLKLVQPWPGRNCAQWREWQQNFISSLWSISAPFAPLRQFFKLSNSIKLPQTEETKQLCQICSFPERPEGEKELTTTLNVFISK